MSPALNTPVTAALERAHHSVDVVLQTMSAVADSLQEGRRIEIPLLNEVVVFLQSFANQCQAAEEDALLFPALEAKCSPSEASVIANLRSGHQNLAALTAELSEATNEYAVAGDSARNHLIEALRRVVALCREHIWSENHIVLALAEKILPREELNALFQAFQRIESQVNLEELAERINLHAQRCSCFMGEVFF